MILVAVYGYLLIGSLVAASLLDWVTLSIVLLTIVLWPLPLGVQIFHMLNRRAPAPPPRAD